MDKSGEITVFVSYAHEDAEHYVYLDAHLHQLRTEQLISTWIDREIKPGQSWYQEILQQLDQAQIVLFLVSKHFLASEFVRKEEIPRAVKRAKENQCVVIPIILEACDWRHQEFAAWQALPPPDALPVSEWHPREVAYAQIARGIAIAAEDLKKMHIPQIRRDSRRRKLSIYTHTPFRILGEAYDPFRAFEQVFHQAEQAATGPLPLLPIESDSLGERIEFVHEDYQTILTWLRDSQKDPGLPFDLVALPYQLLGHCVAQGLLTPLDEELLGRHRDNYVWWSETTEYHGRLYAVPLSALTMVLAIREDLFEQYGLTMPDSWNDYLALLETTQNRQLSIATDLLQGRRHVTLWYEWLIHLYAHNTNDLVLYDARRMPVHKAASSLREGTISYLRHAARLAGFADGNGVLPHWATANWDDGIEQFAQGHLLMHWVFNDALDTLRRRLETIKPAAGQPPPKVRFLPMPKAVDSERRNAHVEGWVLCVPESSRYQEVANEILNWFLDKSVQEEYSRWGGATANLEVLEAQAKKDTDRGAASAYLNSVEDGRTAKTYIDLVKAKEPHVPHAIERIVSDLYDALISVNRGMKSLQGEENIDSLIHETTDLFIQRVESRLLKHPGCPHH